MSGLEWLDTQVSRTVNKMNSQDSKAVNESIISDVDGIAFCWHASNIVRWWKLRIWWRWRPRGNYKLRCKTWITILNKALYETGSNINAWNEKPPPPPQRAVQSTKQMPAEAKTTWPDRRTFRGRISNIYIRPVSCRHEIEQHTTNMALCICPAGVDHSSTRITITAERQSVLSQFCSCHLASRSKCCSKNENSNLIWNFTDSFHRPLLAWNSTCFLTSVYECEI